MQAAVRSKLDMVQSKSKDSPHSQRIAALREEQNGIREKQSTKKDGRKKIQDQVARLDEKIKSLIADQKKEKSRVPFKSVDDVDREIERLQKQVDTGTMKLVDERKALNDISGLHRQKKTFSGFAQGEKQIQELKAQIADLKKTLDDPESKAMNARYDEIQNELKKMRETSDEVYKNVNGLRDERTKLHDAQKQAYDKIKDIKDKYYQAKRDHHNWDQEQRKAKREKYLAEKAAYESGKRREIAGRKLEEASAPAYQEEIILAEGLIRHFDPSQAPVKAEAEPSKFAALASRTVDDSGFKGMRVVKKDDDESYFVGTGGKNKKKGPKKPTASSGPEKFNLSVDVIENLARIGVDPPVSQSHVPIAITQIKEKIEFWKKDQDRKTKEVSYMITYHTETDSLECRKGQKGDCPPRGRDGHLRASQHGQRLQGHAPQARCSQ
jgi:uncharacterized coiled-coil DUF342 family protein